MATPPVIIAAGPPVPDSNDPENEFDPQYEAFLAWQKDELQPKANAQAQGVYDNTVATEAAASTSIAAVVSAVAAKGAAETAAASAINSAGTSAISTTSLALTAGAKSWTIQTGKLFPPGQPIFLASAADSTKRMSGILLTHNPGTGACTANMTPDPGATGTYADWIMGVGVSSASNVTLPRVARTSNIALTVGDKGKLIDITSGSFTQTNDSAGTLGADWFVWLTNSGTGAPVWNGITLAQGTTLQLQSDGTTVRGYLGHLPDQIMVVREEQTSSTGGGTPGAATTWLTRVLNTVQANSIVGASLTSNQVTLPAGTYLIEGSAPAYKADGHKARLYNVTGAATLLVGTTERSLSTEAQITKSWIRGVITLASTSALRVEHIMQSASSNGFGPGFGGAGVTEVYTELFIRRVGP